MFVWVHRIMDQALYPLIYLGYIKQLLPDLTYFQGYGFCIAFIVLGCIINLLGVGIVGMLRSLRKLKRAFCEC
jgi:hypothetical protein